MRKKAIAIMAVAVLFGNVQAEGLKPYLSLNIGQSSVNDAKITDNITGTTAELGSEPGLTFDAAAGIRLEQIPVRFEVEYLHQENDINTVKAGGISRNLNGNTSLNAGMVNFYYDLEEGASPLVISLMGGFGLAKITADLDFPGKVDDTDTVFAFQVGVGVGYTLSEHLMLDAKYAYLTTEDPEFELLEAEIVVHRFTVGLRYSF